ncbi:MAG: hypothetical protein JWQ23_3570 [Herminiimonas sp.]|nr:hypothetical protein [Herminiimonas sp.]
MDRRKLWVGKAAPVTETFSPAGVPAGTFPFRSYFPAPDSTIVLPGGGACGFFPA